MLEGELVEVSNPWMKETAATTSCTRPCSCSLARCVVDRCCCRHPPAGSNNRYVSMTEMVCAEGIPVLKVQKKMVKFYSSGMSEYFKQS